MSVVNPEGRGGISAQGQMGRVSVGRIPCRALPAATERRAGYKHRIPPFPTFPAVKSYFAASRGWLAPSSSHGEFPDLTEANAAFQILFLEQRRHNFLEFLISSALSFLTKTSTGTFGMAFSTLKVDSILYIMFNQKKAEKPPNYFRKFN